VDTECRGIYTYMDIPHSGPVLQKSKYIAKRLVRKTKCVQYISGLKNLNTTKYRTTADLVIANSRGYLTHPDSNLFNILKSLEH